jgi:hypothetical protein
VRVGEAERDVLVAEALALADELPDPDRRRTYQEIAWAAEQGEIPTEWDQSVGELIFLALETGRARAIHGPAGVRALTALWRDTPQGRETANRLDELNEALTALGGLPVEGVRVAATGPGTYTITISAGDCEMRLSLDRGGVDLRSINVGGGGVGE